MPTQAQRRRDCHTIPIMVQKTALTEIQTDTPVGTQEEKKQKELDRKRAQKARKAERELNPDMPPPKIPSVPLPPSPSPPPPFHFDSATTSSTPTRDGLPPPPSWVFDRFAEFFTDRERDFAGANRSQGILHELLADALRFGWESGLKKGRLAEKVDGRHEGVVQGQHSTLSDAPSPIVREFSTVEIQTEPAAATIPRPESHPPLSVPGDTIVSVTVPIPRDLTALQSDSPHPFSTLQRRLARSRRTRKINPISQTAKTSPLIITRRHPRGISHDKPVITTPIPSPPNRHAAQHRSLDWERDPLLSDLGRALGALGWIRRVS
ncbi:hypothetical protein C8J57DRAFT_1368567 [Mycena rebaudengoi]|nr:hypothetical protein C8J57DRAFT_1389253 [Mycena rebaudengoi]KAJ7231950.1 hypothetical protein C8J57DRAFT_1384288 [Mycena rebaudengoi]KAJ7236465.1 hypothetical protein C8J57DRAFT_1376539 [Mycena rebaudengoi]KAJ7241734.1 hypothetical protein C8J57DRAFT_1368567 [Mycena rebaudengoi]